MDGYHRGKADHPLKMPKKVLTALPPGLLEQVDHVADCEHRTRSDLIREALRRYIEQFKRTQSPQANAALNRIETR